jgi:cysteinyl-tRNA synthetase
MTAMGFYGEGRRRLLLGALLAMVAAHLPASAAQRPARAVARTALREARFWGCIYQNVDPADIAGSDLDLVVIDPSLDDDSTRLVTTAEVRAMQRKPDGGRRIVLAYLSVGEADVTRWYWPAHWRRKPPVWLGAGNPRWPGAHHVQFWHPEWQALVFSGPRSLLNHILDTGFDGVLLDRVDAYGDWPLRRGAQEDMVDLVTRLAAKARAARPGFILLPQNAEHLLTRKPYLEAIDALNKESLLTGLNGDGTPNAQTDISWSLGYLRKAQEAGVVTLATEYVADRPGIDAVWKELTTLGMQPFLAHRQLDRMPAMPANADR